MELIKNKKISAAKFFCKVLVPKTTRDFTSRVSKSYVVLYMLIPYCNVFCAGSSQVPWVKK